MKLSVLLERLFTPTGRKSMEADTKYSVEWNDGAFCYIVLGNRTKHTYGCFQDETKANRLKMHLQRRKKIEK